MIPSEMKLTEDQIWQKYTDFVKKFHEDNTRLNNDEIREQM